MNLIDQITTSTIDARPIGQTLSFKGWLLALVPLAAMAFNLDPTQLTAWIELVFQLVALTVLLVANARRARVEVPPAVATLLQKLN